MEAARALKRLKEHPYPLIADIHFDYRLALAARFGRRLEINHTSLTPTE
jgi:4-hydroxy-3-methylbut-2-en-1-yl diphosphate synthase IspG/GcpE